MTSDSRFLIIFRMICLLIAIMHTISNENFMNGKVSKIQKMRDKKRERRIIEHSEKISEYYENPSYPEDESINEVGVKLDKKRNLAVSTNELTTYVDQTSFLHEIYNYGDNSNSSEDIKKINSNVIIINDYIFVGDVYGSFNYIDLFKRGTDGIMAYICADDQTHERYTYYPQKGSMSANYLYLGDYIFFTLSIKVIDYDNFFTNFFIFDTNDETFSITYASHNGKKILPETAISQTLSNIKFKNPYLINALVNDLGATPKMVFLVINFYQTKTDYNNNLDNFYFEVLISSCPASKAELDATSSTIIYEKYNFFEDNIIYKDYFSTERKYFEAYYNSNIFVYSANIILYLYTPMTFDSIGIAYWDYSNASATPPFYNKQIVSVGSRVIISCMFQYNIFNGTKYVSALMYIKNSSSYFVTLVRFNLDNTSQISFLNLQEFSTDIVLYINYFKVTGPWIFYCTESPNECWSWLSNSLDPLDLTNGSQISKIETTKKSNSSVSVVWYVTDMSFYELPKYGEIETYITFYEIIPGTNSAKKDFVRFAKFNLSEFILTNNYPDGSGSFNTLRCFLNQRYDSKTSNKCIDCASETYGENNSCVANCSTGSTNTMGYCSDTQIVETSVYSISNGSFFNTNACNSDEAKINNVCVTCDTNSALLQGDLCEESCRYGYANCDGKTCHEGGCGCNPGELLEDGNCVTFCSLEGLIADKNNVECIECASGLYELNNTDCVDSSSCPLGSAIATIGSYNDSARYCRNCVDNNEYLENSLCVSSCTPPNLPNEDGNCILCSDYIMDGVACVTDCPINKVKIDAGRTCNSCTIVTQYVLNQTSCVDDCPVGYLTETTDKYCYQCTTSPDLYINLDGDACVDSCTVDVEYLNASIGANGKCSNCPGELIYNLSCVSHCPDGYVPDTTNTFCIECTGFTPYVNLLGDSCVDACMANVEYLDTNIANGKCSDCPAEYVYNSGCISDCPIGWIKDSTDKYCLQCYGTFPYINLTNDDCVDSCTANLEYINSSIANGKCSDCPGQLTTSSGCVDFCPVGYAPDISNSYCEECSGTTPYVNLSGDACVSSCTPNIEYINSSIANGKCANCPSQFTTPNGCVDICPSGYIADMTNSYCIECSNPAPYIDLSGSACVSSCAPNTEYLDTTIGNGKCTNCPSQLTTSVGCVNVCPSGSFADNNNEYCTICSSPTPYINLTNNGCVSECTSMETLDTSIGNGKCVICSNYTYNNICISECPGGTNPNMTTKTCDSCVYPTPYLNKTGSECVESCRENEYVNENNQCSECISGTYLYNNECLLTCPTSTIPDLTSKICKSCTSPNSLINKEGNKCVAECQFNEYIDIKIGNGKCSMCASTKYLFNDTCVSNCPSKYFSNFFNRICELICDETQYYDSKNSICLDSCDADVYVINEDEKTCIICSDLNKLKHNNSCVSTCPSGYVADISNTKCLTQTMSESCSIKGMYTENVTCVKSCSDKYYLLNNECISTCPSEYIINYTKDFNNKSVKMCVLCDKYHDSDGNCLDSCPINTTPNNELLCVPCYESTTKPYLLDNKCVSSCSNIYSIKVKGLYDVCILNEETEKLTCTDYCNSNGNCTNLINGDLKCSCFTSYYGNQCQLAKEDLESISIIVTNDLQTLSNTNQNTERVTTDTINDIKEISSLLIQAPEIISDEILNQLVDFINDILTNVENNITQAESNIYHIIDEVLKVKIASNNTNVSVSKLKEGTDALTKKILSGKNLSEITANSSILYKGESFSIQLADNNQESIDEARANSLPIVDFSLCESQLKAAGLLAEDEELYIINSSFDSLLNMTEINADSGISDIVSSSDEISCDIVDKNLNSINTTSCSSFTYKLPVNKDAVDYDDYVKINEKLGVNIYNKSSEFFNDICFRFQSENNTDITVSSRRETYNLTSDCSDECDYDGIDEHGYSICLCESIPPSTKNLFESSIYENLLDNNIILVTCASQAFDSEYLISNIGFWVLCSSTIIIAISLFIHMTFFKMKVIDNSLPKVLHTDATFGIKPSRSGNIKDQNIGTIKNSNINTKLSSIDNDNLLNNGRNEVSENNTVKYTTSKLQNIELKDRKFINYNIVPNNSTNNMNTMNNNTNNRLIVNSNSSSINTLLTVKTGIFSAKNNDDQITKNNLNIKTNSNANLQMKNNKNSRRDYNNSNKLSSNNLFLNSIDSSYLQRKDKTGSKNLLTLSENEIVISNSPTNTNNTICNTNNDKILNSSVNNSINNYLNSNLDTNNETNFVKYTNIPVSSIEATSNNIDGNSNLERKRRRSSYLNRLKQSEVFNIDPIEEESFQDDSVLNSKLKRMNSGFRIKNKNTKNLSLSPKKTSDLVINHYGNCGFNNINNIKILISSENTPQIVGQNLDNNNNRLKIKDLITPINPRPSSNSIIQIENYNVEDNINNLEIRTTSNNNLTTIASNKDMVVRKSEKNLNINRISVKSSSNTNSNTMIVDNYITTSSKIKSKASHTSFRRFTSLNSEITNKNHSHNTNIGNNQTNLNSDDLKFNLEDITMDDVHSENDFNKLPLRIQLKIDDNSVFSFFFHCLIHEHKLLNLFFLKSIINPLWIRLFMFLIELSLEFAFNAAFFTSSIINDQATVKSQEGQEAIGFWFIITNEFWKVFWPVVISTLIMAPVNLIIHVPQKYYVQVNQYLVTKDSNRVKFGYIHFFCWYFVMCFCGVYLNSNTEWLKGSAISLCLSFILFEFNCVFFKTLLWKLAKSYPNKCCIGLYSLYLKFLSIIKA